MKASVTMSDYRKEFLAFRRFLRPTAGRHKNYNNYCNVRRQGRSKTRKVPNGKDTIYCQARLHVFSPQLSKTHSPSPAVPPLLSLSKYRVATKGVTLPPPLKRATPRLPINHVGYQIGMEGYFLPFHNIVPETPRTTSHPSTAAQLALGWALWGRRRRSPVFFRRPLYRPSVSEWLHSRHMHNSMPPPPPT